MLQRKDPFSKTVADTCRILSGWKNKYGSRDTRLTKASDGVAFTTTGAKYKRGNKNKKISARKWAIMQMNVMRTKRMSRHQTKRDKISYLTRNTRTVVNHEYLEAVQLEVQKRKVNQKVNQTSRRELVLMTRKQQAMSMIMRNLHSYKIMYYVLSKTCWQFKKLDDSGQPVHSRRVLQLKVVEKC